jgi:outer membrane biosynthesis protein TonB
MLVAGVEVSTDGVAELALLLERAGHRGLAQRVVIAVARNMPSVGIFASEYPLILSVLDDPPASLTELRATLFAGGSSGYAGWSLSAGGDMSENPQPDHPATPGAPGPERPPNEPQRPPDVPEPVPSPDPAPPPQAPPGQPNPGPSADQHGPPN